MILNRLYRGYFYYISLGNEKIYFKTLDEDTFINTHFPDKYTFIKNIINPNKCYLFHETCENSFYSILKDKFMFGKDGNGGTHFQTPNGSNNQLTIEKSKFILYFEWTGEVEYSKDDTSHSLNKKENVLYNISSGNLVINEDTGLNYWESRIYPNTKEKLYLIAYQTEKNCFNLFYEKIKINIIDYLDYKKFYSIY